MDELTFTHHPARRQPLGSLVVLAMLLVIGWCTWTGLHEVVTTVAMLILYVAYMASFLFPSEYRFDAEGVTLVRMGVRHDWKWQRFRTGTLHPGGVFLCPLRTSTLRGVYLVMDKRQQTLVKPYLEAHLHG